MSYTVYTEWITTRPSSSGGQSSRHGRGAALLAEGQAGVRPPPVVVAAVEFQMQPQAVGDAIGGPDAPGQSGTPTPIGQIDALNVGRLDLPGEAGGLKPEALWGVRWLWPNFRAAILCFPSNHRFTAAIRPHI